MPVPLEMQVETFESSGKEDFQGKGTTIPELEVHGFLILEPGN